MRLPFALDIRKIEIYNPTTDWSVVYRRSWEEQQKTAQAPFAQRPGDPAPAQPPARDTGTFTNPVYGELSVKSDGQTLWLLIGPGRMKMNLVPWNHDTFVAVQSEIDAFPGETGFVRFTFGSDGKVASIILSELADVDDGTFTAS